MIGQLKELSLLMLRIKAGKRIVFKLERPEDGEDAPGHLSRSDIILFCMYVGLLKLLKYHLFVNRNPVFSICWFVLVLHTC